MKRLACRVGLHPWRYFVDGRVCRACPRCRKVQYDLPMVGVKRCPSG